MVSVDVYRAEWNYGGESRLIHACGSSFFPILGSDGGRVRTLEGFDNEALNKVMQKRQNSSRKYEITYPERMRRSSG